MDYHVILYGTRAVGRGMLGGLLLVLPVPSTPTPTLTWLPSPYSVGAPGCSRPPGEACQHCYPVQHLWECVQGRGIACAEQVLPHQVLRVQRWVCT